ncbi:hypothetical protein OG225_12055 [Nocardia sp. NBC_01377]|uniref:hypothetical protein n=1 Tax=Nocardia sp. NBC_01377 TaxID=2903595 RepID=UPI003255C9D4
MNIDHDTYMPTALIVGAAAQSGASVVIAADLDRFGVGYKAVGVACALLLPSGLIRSKPRRAY